MPGNSSEPSNVKSWPQDPRVELAAGLVHDFNNLIQVVDAATNEAIDRLGAEHPAVSELQIVLYGARHLAELSTALLALMHRPYQQGPPDYAHLLMELAPLLARAVGPQIELMVESPSSVARTRLSGLDFERIVLNLVMNASKAISGHGCIHVELGTLSPGGDVGFRVRDTGRGIAPEMRGRIFDPGVKSGGGRGLGLAVVRHAVEQAGGSVVVDDGPDGGAVFSVRLPSV